MPKGAKGGKKTSLVRKGKQKKGAKKKKKVDTFMKKEWFVVKVPTYFENQKSSWRVGFSPATRRKTKKAMNRRCFEINLGDLQDDPQANKVQSASWKMFRFVVQEVFNDKLLTQWNGMRITRDRRCSLIRKWHSMIQLTCDATTTDGYLLRVSALAFTKRQLTQVKKNCYANRQQVKNIRERMRRIVTDAVTRSDLEGVVKQLMQDSINTTIRSKCYPLFPIQNCVVEKVKVVKTPPRDSASIMAIHELKTGYDSVVEEESENEEEEAAEEQKEEAKEDAEN